jgi:hypothetical protein
LPNASDKLRSFHYHFQQANTNQQRMLSLFNFRGSQLATRSSHESTSIAVQRGDRAELFQVEKLAGGSTDRRPHLVFAVAVDASSSMEGRNCETVIDALLGRSGVVSTLLQPTDLFGCVTFNSDVQKLHHPMPLDKVTLSIDEKHIRSNTERGGCTAIYDAIATGIRDLRESASRGRRPKCLEHLVLTDGYDNASSTSFADICAMVAKPGVAHYHLVVIGAGMDSDDRAKMSTLCAPKHCTFIPSAADLSSLGKVLHRYKKEVMYRMQLTVRSGNCQSTTRWEGRASHAAKAASTMLQQAPLLSEQMGGLRITNGDGGSGRGNGKGGKGRGKGKGKGKGKGSKRGKGKGKGNRRP